MAVNITIYKYYILYNVKDYYKCIEPDAEALSLELFLINYFTAFRRI